MPQTFKTFLTEGVTHLSLTQFPLASQTPHFVEWLSQINAALDAKQIPNPEFTVLKYNLSNKIKWPLLPLDSMNQAVRGSMEHTVWIGLKTQWEGDVFNWNDNLEFHTAAGKLKKAEAWLKKNSGATALLVEHAKAYIAEAKEKALLGEALATLKTMAVKRVAKTDDQKAAEKQATFRAQTSSEAMKMVHDVLKKMTDELMPALIKFRLSLFEHQWEQLQQFLAAHPDSKALYDAWYGDTRDKTDRNKQKQLHNQFREILSVVKGFIKNDYGTAQFVQSGDPKSHMKAEAERLAKDVQQGFLFKNVGKLAAILEKKGNVKGDPKILNLHYSSGIFEGDIKIEFLDGSEFRVRNKIVWKWTSGSAWSGSGPKSFTQFPTTFHDAILPNGTRMPGQPSERDMVEKFAVA